MVAGAERHLAVLLGFVTIFVIPVLGALAAGFRLQIGTFILEGIRSISSVIGMFVFAILFFGFLTDAMARAPSSSLSPSILAERLQTYGFEEVRVDYIGVNSIHGDPLSLPLTEPYEVRLRVACRAASSAIASMVPREVEALYTNGPSGGGGVTTTLK